MKKLKIMAICLAIITTFGACTFAEGEGVPSEPVSNESMGTDLTPEETSAPETTTVQTSAEITSQQTVPPDQSQNESVAQTSIESLFTTVETSDIVTTEPAEDKLPREDFTLSDEEMSYFDDFIFVGDSICLGYSFYGVLPANNVYAQGGIAARNIHDFAFSMNYQYMDILQVLYKIQPKYIVFSMGMNDVNMTTRDQFASNYLQLLEDTQKTCPNSELIVLATTPICCDFSNNTRIDAFNKALKAAISDTKNKHWHFINPTEYLKDINNNLIYRYTGGDGIHLNPEAYNVVLWYIYNHKISYTFSDKDKKKPIYPSEYEYVETTPPTTTAVTTKKPAVTTSKKN